MALNINTTTSTASTTAFNKTYYDRQLLEYAKTKFVHAQFGQKRGIPKNSGKIVEFRKMELFTPSTAPLSEGTVPDGQSLSQSSLTATCLQYGAYVTVSDMLELTSYDPVIGEANDLLAEQIGTTIDWVTRDAMCAGTNVQYIGTVTSRLGTAASNILTFEEVRKAVRALKKAKAPTFKRGGKEYYVAIVSPDTVYDLQSDTHWENVAMYQDKEKIYAGEIGRMYGVLFLESTEAKIYAVSVNNAVNAATNASTDFVLKNTPTDAEVAYLSEGGNKLYIGGTEVTLDADTPYTAATKTVKLSEAATLAKDAVVQSQDAGACNGTTKLCDPIHATLIFGENAFGNIDIAGSGNIKSIVKPKGSGGTSDPLDQFSTVGVKVEAYVAKILQPLWIRRIEHGVTA